MKIFKYGKMTAHVIYTSEHGVMSSTNPNTWSEGTLNEPCISIARMGETDRYCAIGGLYDGLFDLTNTTAQVTFNGWRFPLLDSWGDLAGKLVYGGEYNGKNKLPLALHQTTIITPIKTFDKSQFGFKTMLGINLDQANAIFKFLRG